MNTRAFLTATGAVLLVSAANTAFHGKWAVSGMDEFAGSLHRRLQTDEDAAAKAQGRDTRAAPSESELFNSLNNSVGHHLGRVILSSLAVQAVAGVGLVVAGFMMRPTAGRRAEDDES
jgi:hypothetical protein